MSNDNYTPESIFTLIDNKSVSREVGIKLIENYGIRQQGDAVEKLQNELGGYSAEIEAAINRINARLEEMFNQTVRACTHTEGL